MRQVWPMVGEGVLMRVDQSSLAAIEAALADGRAVETTPMGRKMRRKPPSKPRKVKPVAASSWSVTLRISGLVVVSEMNRRDHWAVRRKRFETQRILFVAALIGWPIHDAINRWSAFTVTFTRLGAKQLDSDNLAGAFKAVRDSLASWIGVDDGDPRITWLYDQRPGEPGIEVRIEGAMQ